MSCPEQRSGSQALGSLLSSQPPIPGLQPLHWTCPSNRWCCLRAGFQVGPNQRCWCRCPHHCADSGSPRTWRGCPLHLTGHIWRGSKSQGSLHSYIQQPAPMKPKRSLIGVSCSLPHFPNQLQRLLSSKEFKIQHFGACACGWTYCQKNFLFFFKS